ncbi:MAG: type IX secretion system sortase PorU [Sediminibacterium sp.]|nr:type IX secretion system sortase PorU [Sediminibacterium sp.]
MGKAGRYIWLILVVFWALIGSKTAMAQVGIFSKGVWGKVGVTARGVYKIDMAALNSMGLVPAGGVTASDKIRLFGSGGAMLPEAVGEQRPSAFTENALLINDGGDGILSGQDFIIFYAPGPHRWHYNSNNDQYNYEQNLYSDTAFYFLNVDGNIGENIGGSASGTIGAAAKRIGAGNAAYLNSTAGLRVNSFTDNWVYEKDNINVLASGKLWLGDAFSMASGGITTRNYVVDMPRLISSDSVTLKMYAAARSIGVPANFAVRVNNNLVQNVTLPAVSGGFLDTYASYVSAQTKFIAGSGALQLSLQFSAGGGSGVGFGAEGFLDKIECTATKVLSMSSASSGALFFRSGPVVSAAPAGFVLNAGGAQNFSNTTVLDANNNLHALALDTAANYLIITHPSLVAAANKLAQFHTAQKAGIKPLVVTTTQMYQAFGSGSPDITSIRDGVGFFARAYGELSSVGGGGAFAQKEFYVLLLGASSYDYKNRTPNNVNLVPGYQSSASLDPLSSYTSDDYFALLDSSANINIEPLLTNINATNTGVNIGRIPAKNITEANTVIDKIINYHNAQSQGPWRLQQRFIADDKDFNLHVQDAEAVSAAAQKANALFNQQKIYLDAYPLISGSGGGRYPAVNEAVVNAFNSGSLVINYSGHGNYLRLADEAIFSSTEIPLINNANKLPLVITASCDFYPYDDPTKKSLGQQLLFGAGNVGAGNGGVGGGSSNTVASGAIALLTTPRLVFAYSNKIINENYFVAAHKPDANTGLLPTLGEAVKNAKNLTVQQSRDFINTRKFALLGDPAMRLAYPNSNIVLDSVNSITIGANDTLVSGKLYTFKGSVMAPRSGAIGINNSTSINTSFNGTLYFTLYDKQITRTTLKNDPATVAANYNAQENILYAGLVSVANGKFTVSFVLPLDISYAPGKAKISMYAQQTINPASPTTFLPDAAGVDTSFYTMGSGAVITDKVGPVIDLFLNDYNFKNGGLTHSDPVLLINLQDVSGINTSSSAIGHDIIVTLDNNPATTRTLNSFYQANINTYQYGTVRYQLPTLTPGPHTLKVRAWDNVNNSNTRTLGFTVAATAGSSGATGGGTGGAGTASDMSPLVIDKVVNFPNPFTSQTTFSFEHNFPGQNIEVNLSIYTQNGKLVKQINKTANTNGTRNVQITWDGTDAAGSKIARNVYIYKIQISAAGTNYQSSGKLICL